MTQKRPHSASFPMARDVAASSQIASVDSPSPPNGLLKAENQHADQRYHQCAESDCEKRKCPVAHALAPLVMHPRDQKIGNDDVPHASPDLLRGRRLEHSLAMDTSHPASARAWPGSQRTQPSRGKIVGHVASRTKKRPSQTGGLKEIVDDTGCRVGKGIPQASSASRTPESMISVRVCVCVFPPILDPA